MNKPKLMTLYSAPNSSAIPVVHTFIELDVPHELVTVEIGSAALREADFLALNPNGKVPTLVVDGTPMFEAVAIVQWLGDQFGVERGLWPSAEDPARLEALSWTTWAYVTLGAVLKHSILSGSPNAPAELKNPAHAAYAVEELEKLMAILDQRMSTRTYVVGDTYSLVDLVLGDTVTYAEFCGLSVAPHPHLKAWLARCKERPAYQKTWAPAA